MKSQIVKEYPYKAELHAHTLPISKCSHVYAEELVKIYKAIGVDTVVLTNHFTPVHIADVKKEEIVQEYIQSFHDLKNIAEANGMCAVFGVELRFTENINDYLIFGLDENDLYDIYEYMDKGIDFFYQDYKAKRKDILIFQAHPFRDNMTETNPSSIDGIEAFNLHPGHNARIALAVAHAKKHRLLISGGTDFHQPGCEGCCLIRTKKKLKTGADVVETLKKQDFVLDIFGSVILP